MIIKKAYYLIAETRIIQGPIFSLEQAYIFRSKLNPILIPLVSIYHTTIQLEKTEE